MSGTRILSRCALAGVASLVPGLVLAALARPARADEHRTSSLSWVELSGAGSCGGAPTVARAVEARLGRHAIVSPVDAELSIEAYVERSGRPPLWHAVVQVRGRDGALLGSRELASAADDCDELRASVALVAALMIDPDAAQRAHGDPAPGPPSAREAPPPPPAAPPSCPPPPEPPPPRVIVQRVEVQAPTPPPTLPTPWTVEPSAMFALGFGVLPSLAAGVSVGAGIGLPRPWAFEVFGTLWGDQSVGAAQAAQVRFGRVDVGAAACPLTLGAMRRLRFTACAGLEVGFIQTSSRGFAAPESSLSPTLRLVAPAALSLPIGPGFSIELGGAFGVTLVGNQFFYRDPANSALVVATQPLVTGETTLGLGVDLN